MLPAETDAELVQHYRNGDEYAFVAIMERHAGLIYSIAKEYFIQGASRADAWQEGCIGFYKAVRDYDLEHPFPTFAALCIHRQVISAVKRASTKKYSLLVAYELIENIEEPCAAEPVDVDLSLVEAMLALLTPMERRIMEHRLDGCCDYSDLSSVTGYSVKSIDNALNRSRKKIRQALAA